MKIFVFILVIVLALCVFAGCSAKEFTCDHCGKTFMADDGNMEEDWIIFCGECNEKLFEGDPLLDPDLIG